MTAVEGPSGHGHLPASARHLADPHPLYRRLREEDPVHWNARGGFWAVTSREQVMAALDHPLLSVRRHDWQTAPGPGRAVSAALASWMLRLDPPEHTRLRRRLNDALPPRAVRAMSGAVEGAADELIDAAAPGGRMDGVSQFASPLVATVIMRMVGLPRHDHDRFRRASEAVAAFAAQGPGAGRAERAHEGLLAASRCLRPLLERRRAEPADDLLGRLVREGGPDDGVTEAQAMGLAMLLLLAGHETTAYALAHAIRALLLHREQLLRLRADPSLSGSAVEELLRYDSPLHGVLRRTAGDLELGGRRLHEGQAVVVWLAAANRDEARYEEPDRLDVARTLPGHLAFGHGIHRCPGAPLARLVLRIALVAVLERLPDLELASGPEAWQGNALFRTATSVPLVFRPRRRP